MDERKKNWLQAKIGQEVIIYCVDDWYDTFYLQFEDGQKLTLKGLESNPFKENENLQEKYSLQPTFYYEILDLDLCNHIESQNYNTGCHVQNKLYKVSNHKISYQYEPNQ